MVAGNKHRSAEHPMGLVSSFDSRFSRTPSRTFVARVPADALSHCHLTDSQCLLWVEIRHWPDRANCLRRRSPDACRCGLAGNGVASELASAKSIIWGQP